jgi:hypothetical protein
MLLLLGTLSAALSTDSAVVQTAGGAVRGEVTWRGRFEAFLLLRRLARSETLCAAARPAAGVAAPRRPAGWPEGS